MPNKFTSATVPEIRDEAKMQTIAEEQEQIREEDDYEWEAEDDAAGKEEEIKAAREEKEGGNFEMYDGGNKELDKTQKSAKKSIYLNWTKLYKDISLFR